MLVSDRTEPDPASFEAQEEVFVAHVGWLKYPSDDVVLTHLREGWFEFRELALLWSFLQPGDVFLDIGAHAGLFSAIAAGLVGAGGRVHAFEPNPAVLPYLRANVTAPNVEVHPLAMSDRNGTASLSQGDEAHTAFSSIAYGIGEARVDVPTRTLDDVMASLGIQHAALAKLDVEGSEQAVLRGGRATLLNRKILAILVEFTEENMQNAGYSAPELYRALGDVGYRGFRLDRECLRLIPHQIEGEVPYENFLFTHDPSQVERRLRSAPPSLARCSGDVYARGLAAERLVHGLWDLQQENARRLQVIEEQGERAKLLEHAVKELQEENAKRLKLIEGQQARASILEQACEDRLALIQRLQGEIVQRDCA